MTIPAVEIHHLQKSFNKKTVLDIPELIIPAGSFVIIEGPSGAGKSTLLSLVGLLDSPDQGDIQLFGQTVKPYSRKSIQFFKEKIGWLFQNYALVDSQTVEYNLDMVLDQKKQKNKSQLLQDALHQVGLEGKLASRIYELSGGEQQRVALARLLLKSCDLILADEPTGNLDRENAKRVMNLLKAMQSQGKTILVVSHDRSFDELADQIIQLNSPIQ
ncbi:ATP-binding cassette domain-containing protein [Allobaculum sp. JKK-2023]|uniref:ATP-binding cassette domain-containing protein n=1 Tax=Allobaculum sp. JKK-2023 TaxID=3108943 RepID=UPI002B05DCC1|nr:ATP-binding cassette domain-containing protein [Allobaculum sp. JKK-2023]